MNQTEKEGITQGLIKSLRTGQAAKVTLKKCVRDLRDLSVIIDPNKESAWAKGVDVDQLVADQDQEGQQVDDQEDQGQAQEDAQEEAHEDLPAPAPAPVTIVPVDPSMLNVPVPVSQVRVGRPIREKVRPKRYREI